MMLRVGAARVSLDQREVGRILSSAIRSLASGVSFSQAMIIDGSGVRPSPRDGIA